jgi:hypothetical protein
VEQVGTVCGRGGFGQVPRVRCQLVTHDQLNTKGQALGSVPFSLQKGNIMSRKNSHPPRVSSTERELNQRSKKRYTEPAPSLLVRLLGDLGKLPAGILIQFPSAVALSLVRYRVATPVSELRLRPDLVIDEEDMMHTGIPTGLYPTLDAKMVAA